MLMGLVKWFRITMLQFEDREKILTSSLLAWPDYFKPVMMGLKKKILSSLMIEDLNSVSLLLYEREVKNSTVTFCKRGKKMVANFKFSRYDKW